MARRRRRRPLLVLLALLVLAGVAVGVVYVLHAAKKRTNLFQQALTAHRSGHDEEAESDLKSLLAANPGHARGRALLIQLLLSRGKTDEAEALARYWLGSSDTEAMGTQTLSEIAFRQLDFDKALGLARQVVDRDPAFAQAMTVQVETVRGSPADRARAARASETLASLVSTPEDAAAAWLFAAETWQEIERSIPQGEAPRVVTARASAQERTELAARKARDALHRSPIFSGSLELSTLYMNKIPAIKAIGARIDLVSGDPEGQANAVAYLEDYLSTRPEACADRAALARYYLAHDALPKATEQVRALAEGPTLIYVRALGELAAAGGRAAVLEMIESRGATPGKLLALLKARLLVGGTDPSERAAGEALLEKMAIEAPKDWPLVLDASRRIREAGDPDRATKLLQEVAAAVPDLGPAASIERAVQAIRAGHPDDAQAPLEEVARLAPARDLLQAYQVLSHLGDAGHVAGLDLLREAGDTDREGRDQIRLLRAAVWSVEAGADPEGRLYHDLAAEDLRSLAKGPTATRATLTNVAALATSSGNLEVAGTAVGRALVAEGDSGEPVDLFLRALGSTDPTDRERVARGLREAAAPEGPYAGWQGTLARALEQGDGAPLRRPAEMTPAADSVPQPTEALLQCRLAQQAGDWAEAEAHAREILRLAPKSELAPLLLGASLLAEKRYEDVLAANPEADELPPPRQAQRIDALVGLGRDPEAVEQARRLVRATNGSDRSLLILAHLLQKTNPDAAYSAISAVSGGPALEAYRAQLLQERGDADSAAQVYEDLLRSSGDRDLRAWGGLARISAARNRDWDFIERASAVVESPPPGFPPAGVAQLRLLRGQAEEHTGSYDAAIEDYRGVLAVLPKSVVALNNLAWLLGTKASGGPDTQTAQRREALDLATQAVALAPTVAQIHHTRAKILQSLGQNDDALAAYDQAAARVEALQKSEPADAQSVKDELASRHGRYLIDKSALLESMGRVDDARALYETIRTQDAGTTAAREAAAALARLGS